MGLFNFKKRKINVEKNNVKDKEENIIIDTKESIKINNINNNVNNTSNTNNKNIDIDIDINNFESYIKAYNNYLNSDENNKIKTIYKDRNEFFKEMLYWLELFTEESEDIEDRVKSLLFMWYHKFGMYPERDLGIYTALCNDDMNLFNNVLYQNALGQYYKKNCMQGATPFSYSYFILPDIFASNYTELIPLLLPKDLGITNFNLSGGIILNLYLALIYGEEYIEEAVTKAKKYLLKKSNRKGDVEIVNYLLALIDRDFDNASIYLQNVCNTIKKVDLWEGSKISKSFSMMAHGLYNLSNYINNGEFRGKVKMPKANNFCIKLANWQIENNFKKGEIAYYYPEEFDVLNILLNITPPKICFKEINKEIYVDFEKFKEDVTNKVKENMK